MKHLLRFFQKEWIFSKRSGFFPAFKHNVVICMLVFMGILSSALYGQGSISSPPNYYQLLNNYFANPIVQNDTSEGGEKNEVYRSAISWGERAFPHGDFDWVSNKINQYATEFQTNSIASNNCSVPSDWKYLTLENMKIGFTGRINRITFDPRYGQVGAGEQTLYCASETGGVWRSEDDGLHWSVLPNVDTELPFTAIGDIAINPNDHNMIFIATGTADEGYGTKPNSWGNHISVSPLYSSGVYRATSYTNPHWESINGSSTNGVNLMDVFSRGGTIRKMAVNPANSDEIVLATTVGIFKTTNASAPTSQVVWQKILPISGEEEFRAVDYRKDNSGVIIASGKRVCYSTDGGASWTTIAAQDINSFTNIATGALLFESITQSVGDYIDIEKPVGRINFSLTTTDPNKIFIHFVGEYAITNIRKDFCYVINVNTQIPNNNCTYTKLCEFVSWQTLPRRVPIAVSQGSTTNQPLNIICGNAYFQYISYDLTQGNIFTPSQTTPIHMDYHVFECHPSRPYRFFMGNDGGVAVRDYSAVNSIWESRNVGLGVATPLYFDDSEWDNDLIVVATQDDESWMNANASQAGTNWSNIEGGDGYGIGLDDNSPNWGIYYNASLGNTLQRFIINNNLTSVVETNELPNVPADPFGGNQLISPYFSLINHPIDDKLWMSFSELNSREILNPGAGQTPADIWNLQSDITDCDFGVNTYLEPWQRQLRDVEISENNPNRIYAIPLHIVGYYPPNDYDPGTMFAFFKSETGGCNDVCNAGDGISVTFTNIGGNILTGINPFVTMQNANGTKLPPPMTGIAIDPMNEDRIWICFSGYEEAVKVWHSEDGGDTWENWDTNGTLANLPVNDIIYQSGSDDRLYIATDAGVYVKEGNSPSNNWCRLGNNLPNVRVNHIKLNYCTGLIRVSTYGRGLWQVPALPISRLLSERLLDDIDDPNIIEDPNDQDPGPNHLWQNGEKSLKTNLRIQSNTTLTLNNFTLSMPYNGMIYIEKGAKLVLNNAKITNFCGAMWGGIEVMGDPSLTQLPDAQGKYQQGVVTLNNAVIEHAHTAITTDYLYEPEQWGGIIKAQNSVFANNQRAIAFMKYDNFDPVTGNSLENESYFRDCRFYIDNDYRGDDPTQNAPFKAHITAWAVRGIDLTACHFENNKTLNVDYAEQLGTGIYTYDAGFTVKGTCSAIPPVGTNPPCPTDQIIPSVFKGLYHGIYAMRESELNTFTVHGAAFENNIKGIVSQGINFPTMLQNRFEVGGNPYPILNSDPIHEGIVINTGTGYTIEENEMHTVPPNGDFRYTVGTRIANTGAKANLVYKNSYEGFYVGELANGNNVDMSFTSNGLRFLCNDHTEDFVDIASTDSPNGMITDDGISSEQKPFNSNKSAGNTFSQNGNFAEGDFYNRSDVNLRYLYYTGAGEPLYYTTGKINKFFAQQNECPSNIELGLGSVGLSGGEESELKQSLHDSHTAYSNLSYNYSQLIDGGNTNSLIQNIELTWSDDAWELREELLSRSPYLSEEAIRKAAEGGVLPHAMLMEVLLANVAVLRNDRLIDYLANDIATPLPNYYIEILRNAWAGNSPRTLLENAMADQEGIMTLCFNHLAKNWLQDSVQNQTDSVLSYLSLMPDISSHYLLSDLYYERGQSELATQTLAAIPTIFRLTEAQIEEYIQYENLLSIKIAIKNSGRNFSQLTESEQVDLAAISNASDHTAGIMANNILCFHYGTCKNYPATLPLINSQRKPQSQPTSTEENLKIYPNPANDFIVFDYSRMDIADMISIEIRDITGKLILVLDIKGKKDIASCDTQLLSNGVYMYKVIREGLPSINGQFVIQH